MTIPKQPWGSTTVQRRLPNPADAASATVAGRWQSVSKAIDPERLPVTLEVREGELAMLGVRWLLGAAGISALLLAGGVAFQPRDRWDPLELALALTLLPGMLAGLALWIWIVHRRTPRRERLYLALDVVRYESGSIRWEEPIRAYAGLALRRHRTQRASRRARRPMRTRIERELRLGEEVERWWIELVHDLPSRTVVIWASDRSFASSDGLDLAERLGERLRLPVLTTSGIRRVDDRDDDAEGATGRTRE